MSPAEGKDPKSGVSTVAIDEEVVNEDTGHAEVETDQAEPDTAPADEVKRAEFQPVSQSPTTGTPASMDLLMDVTLAVSVELGKTTMSVKEILSVCQGSVIELDRAAGEPVDILVGGRLLGKGEVVVLNDRFGVRITRLINPVEGAKHV
jgi:flagellar motor switch protein FliN/FliY